MAAKEKGKKVHVSVFPAFGATPATGFAGVVATNFAFNLGENKTTDMSSIAASASYTTNSQFVLPIRSNIWLKDNKWNLLGDWRFMKYPQETYGLGGKSPKDQGVQVDFLYLRLYQQVLRSLGSRWFGGGGVFSDQFWGIEQENWNKPFQSDFEKYGYGTASRAYAGGFGLNVLWDDRKNVINPRQGAYGSILYRINPSWLGNNNPWESVYADFRKYIFLPRKMEKNVLGFWLLYWGIVRGNPPYLLLPSNGWDTYTSSGRGYVQGRFRAKHMVTFETEYRYRISRNGLLGGVVFANASTYSESPSGKFQSVNPSIGTGFRIKLNKTSDTNLIVDFAFGLPSSKGFYLDVGEIF